MSNSETVIPDEIYIDPEEVAESVEAAAIETEQETETKEPRQRPRRSAQERIDEAIWQREEAKRDAGRLRQEIEALKNPVPQAKPAGQPSPDDYPAGRYDPDYLEARQDWQIEQRFKAQDQAAQSQAKQGTIAQLESAVAEKYADYDSAKNDFFSHDLASVPAFMELVRDSENPAELAYYLGKNPGELDKLGELTPAQANRYIGRLEAQFNTDIPTPTPKKATSAPKPIAPLSSARGSSTGKDPKDMTMDEYAAYRKAQK